MDPTLVSDAIIAFAEFLIKYLIALAAVGALTMALIEAAKKLFNIRVRYQRNALERWVRGDREAEQRLVETRFAGPADAGIGLSADGALSELLHLTTGSSLERSRTAAQGGTPPALFSLELDRMMGQVQEAVDAALDNPRQYRNLYFFATAGASSADAMTWFENANRLPEGENVGRAVSKERADLYARLHQLAKRKLDAFQLQTDYTWTNRNQFAAIVIGALVLGLTLISINTKQLTPAGLWPLLLASAIGGILSPIAKDLITLLNKVKERG